MSLETQKKNLLFIAILKVFHSLKFYRMRLISPKDVVVNRNFIRKKKKHLQLHHSTSYVNPFLGRIWVAEVFNIKMAGLLGSDWNLS